MNIRFLFIPIILLLFNACDSDSKVIDDFDPNNIIIVDTASIRASTIILDPLPTSGRGLSVGRYKDPYLGIVSAKAFAEVNLGYCFSLRRGVDDQFIPVVYDSLVFITDYSNHNYKHPYYGDTLKEQTIRIHRLKEEMDFGYNDYSFYNHTSFDCYDEPLGELKFSAQPTSHSDSYDPNEEGRLRIPLSDTFGEKLVHMALMQNDTLLDNYKWNEYFKGVVLDYGPDDEAAILKLSDEGNATKMRLYYHEIEGEYAFDLQYHDFPVNQSNINFTNYETDRTGTVLADLKDTRIDLNSEECEGLTFVQCGNGLATKLEIPYWDEMLLREDIGELLKVELELYPLHLSSREFNLPMPLCIYTSDDDNQLFNPLMEVNKDGSVGTFPLHSSYVVNSEFRIYNHYCFDLIAYLKPKLEDFTTENIHLIVLPIPDVQTSFVERIVFDNKKKSDFAFRLKAIFKNTSR